MNFQAVFGQHYSIECIQNTSFCNLYLFSFPKRYRFLFAKSYGFGDIGGKIVADGQIFEIQCNPKGLGRKHEKKINFGLTGVRNRLQLLDLSQPQQQCDSLDSPS